MSRLMIPMLVEAYASGKIRPEQKNVPVITPNYKTALSMSVLGQKSTPDIGKKSPEPLETGIHLHFILPDAFTHSNDGTDFPAVPNRYIITRLRTDSIEKKIISKNFVVESDFISADNSYGKSVTIPFFKDSKKPWRYLGRSYEEGNNPLSGGNYLKKLTAIGAGDVFFSSYYPNCRSVFGFYDDLSDMPPDMPAELIYFVTGYFSDVKNDPFSEVKTEEDFQKILALYRLSVSNTKNICRRCILYGAVDKIEWKGENASYCPTPCGKVNIAVGNTSAEALSLALSKSSEGESFDERMLTALQYELYDEVNTPDGNFKIDDEIHAQSFNGFDGGDLKNSLLINDGKISDLGMEFSHLQETGHRYGELKRLMSYEKKKLFSVWEQYVLLYEGADCDIKNYPSRSEMINQLNITVNVIKKLETELTSVKNSYDNEFKTFKQFLSPVIEIEEAAEEKFFAAKDPVLLLYGEGLNRSFAFGEDGRFTTDGTLFCQTSCVLPVNIDKTGFFSRCFLNFKNTDLLPDFDDLIIQTVLVCEQTRKNAESILGRITVKGELPCDIAVNTDSFNWTTLFMMWKAEYRPTRTDKSRENTLDRWKFEYGDTNLVYDREMSPEKISESYSYYGKTPLTPHAVKTLSDAVKRYGEIYEQQNVLGELSEKIRNLPIISQSLGGFTDCLSSFIPAFQFPVMSIDEDDIEQNMLAKTVSENTDTNRRSITVNQNLLPMRGGFIKISDLTLVGSFGQTQPLIYNSYYNNSEIDFAQTISFSNGYALLPPCFSVPSRLNADFVCAKNDKILSSPIPETTPVHGIVIPEVLNRRLLAYSAGGNYMGMIKTVYRQGKPQSRWISAPGTERSLDKLHFDDDTLKEFLKNLLIGNAFYEFNGLTDKYLDNKECREGLIWGRPLVLARARLSLEFFGKPEFSKKYDDFGKYDTMSAEDVRIKVKLGDIQRLTDGLLGFFKDKDFSEMYPPFGAENPYNTEEYVKYSKETDISNSDKFKFFTVLTAPNSPLNIQTGILPIKRISIDSAHVKIAEELPLTAEISPVIAKLSGETDAPFPVQADGESCYKWTVLERETYGDFVITPAIADFEKTFLTDGYIVKE